MSRTEHIINRFHTRLGESWWWRRFSDLIDRRQEDGTYKPFDARMATQLMMTRRNREKYKDRIAMGLQFEHKLPYRARPDNQMQTEVPMIERPEGMTRQTQRRLYREACKLAGVAPVKTYAEPSEFMKKLGYKKLPRSWRGMPEWQRKVEEEKLWQEYKARHVTVSSTPGIPPGVLILE